ncbi:hypothetical protein C8R45DRAFT_941328 [Mycena sanguinolenta]|nr:hypothetical protein C8R45DRAFT_941328 [Mycena sanguinolenta]
MPVEGTADERVDWCNPFSLARNAGKHRIRLGRRRSSCGGCWMAEVATLIEATLGKSAFEYVQSPDVDPSCRLQSRDLVAPVPFERSRIQMREVHTASTEHSHGGFRSTYLRRRQTIRTQQTLSLNPDVEAKGTAAEKSQGRDHGRGWGELGHRSRDCGKFREMATAEAKATRKGLNYADVEMRTTKERKEDWRQSWDGGKDAPTPSHAAITNTAPSSPAPRAPAAASFSRARGQCTDSDTIGCSPSLHRRGPSEEQEDIGRNCLKEEINGGVDGREEPTRNRAVDGRRWGKSKAERQGRERPGGDPSDALWPRRAQATTRGMTAHVESTVKDATTAGSTAGMRPPEPMELKRDGRANDSSVGGIGHILARAVAGAFITAAGAARIQRRQAQRPETASTSIRVEHLPVPLSSHPLHSSAWWRRALRPRRDAAPASRTMVSSQRTLPAPSVALIAVARRIVSVEGGWACGIHRARTLYQTHGCRERTTRLVDEKRGGIPPPSAWRSPHQVVCGGDQDGSSGRRSDDEKGEGEESDHGPAYVARADWRVETSANLQTSGHPPGFERKERQRKGREGNWLPNPPPPRHRIPAISSARRRRDQILIRVSEYISSAYLCDIRIALYLSRISVDGHFGEFGLSRDTATPVKPSSPDLVAFGKHVELEREISSEKANQ